VRTDSLPHGGQVVNFVSIGALAPSRHRALLCAGHAAVRNFSRSASMDLFPQGVYVTLVCADLPTLREGEPLPAWFGSRLRGSLLRQMLPLRPREVSVGAVSYRRQLRLALIRMFPYSRLAAYLLEDDVAKSD